MRSTIRCPRRSMKARFSAWHSGEASCGKGSPPGTERLGERDRLAEVHEHAAEAPLQELAGAHQPEHALFALAPARELLDHRALLHQALVGDRDRHEEEVAPRRRQEGVDVPGEHPEPGSERLAGARAPALDEELLRDAGADQVPDVRSGTPPCRAGRRSRGAGRTRRRGGTGIRRGRRPCSRAPRCAAGSGSWRRTGRRRSGSRNRSGGSGATPVGAAWRSRPPSRSPTPRPRRRAGG